MFFFFSATINQKKAAILVNCSSKHDIYGNYDYPKCFLPYLLDDGLESLRVVDCEVSKNLAVDFDASLVQGTHEY